MKTLFTILILFTTFNFGISQIQIGDDLTGILTDDDFGYSVSISDDGQRVAIGAPGNIIGQEAGYVQIFQKSGTDWVQLGNTITGKLPFNNAGGRLALSGDGNRLILGAIYNNNGTMSGSVLVYQYNGFDWAQMGSPLGTVDELMSVGRAVAISGNGNVIAFTTTMVTSISEITGRVDVFEWQGSGWQKRGNTFLPTETFDLYGYALDLSDNGSRIAIGASNGIAPATGQSSGFAQIFQFQNGNWLQVGSNIYGKYSLSSFGKDVSLSGNGNRIIVSGPGSVNGLILTGTVRAFDFNGNDWHMVGDELIGTENFDRFGEGIKLSKDGNSFVYGSTRDGNGAGCAALYKLVGNSWEMHQNKVCGDFDRDDFGFSVDVSNNGASIVTGARVNDEDGVKNGYARVWNYEMTSSNLNLEERTLKVFPNPASDRISLQTNSEETTFLSVYNMNQQLVLQQIVKPKEEIDIEFLSSGMYILLIQTGDQNFYSKLIKN